MNRTQTRWLAWTVPALAVGLLVLPASGAEPKDTALPKRPAAVHQPASTVHLAAGGGLRTTLPLDGSTGLEGSIQLVRDPDEF